LIALRVEDISVGRDGDGDAIPGVAAFDTDADPSVS
jgi:hypothetical protein